MHLKRTIVTMSILLCGLINANASDTAGLYRGKILNLVVNYTAGGSTDLEARLMSRHLSKHIPGQPTVVVRNMSGAGGMIGANWLGQIAPPDGLTVGYLTGMVAAAVHGNPALKIDPSALPFIAAVEATIIYYARADLDGGLTQSKDLMQKRNFWVGGLTPDSQKDLTLRAQLDLLEIPYRYVSGYPGSNDVRLALERNEVQMTSESLPAYRTSIEPNLVQTRKVLPLWYDTSSEFRETGDPSVKGLPIKTFQQYYSDVKGKAPDNELWQMMEVMSEVGTRFLRTLHMPPKTDEANIKLLRAALAALSKDPEYLAEARTILHHDPRISVGADAEAAYARSVKYDPELGEYIRNYVAQGIAKAGK